jgi:hypothetical protein
MKPEMKSFKPHSKGMAMLNNLDRDPIIYEKNHPVYCMRGHLRAEWQFVDSQVRSLCKKCRRDTQRISTYKYERNLPPEVLKERWKKSNFSQGEKFPEKMKARKAVRNAIAQGKFERKPCEVCGNDKTDFHHSNGYQEENWFVGNFLCRKHHAERHNEMKTLNTKQDTK